MSNTLTIVGIGPGAEGYVTPDVSDAIARATDAVGYIPYIERLPVRPDLVCHPSDNRVELDRARHALDLAAAGGMLWLCLLAIQASLRCLRPYLKRWNRITQNG